MSGTRHNTTRHVAIIMDGNGRWASQRGLPRVKGHEQGAESIRAVLRAASKTGLKYLTLYAFSVENWKRPRTEVAHLMRLLRTFTKKHEDDLHEHKIRLRIMGRMEDLPGAVVRELHASMERTAAYPDHQLILALSYSGRSELVHAVKQIAGRVKSGDLRVEDITEETIARHLYLPDVPDPDLIIRTGGEMRLSNFLLWQASYAEIYVTEVLWPDFREPDFIKAMAAYGRRERRFGNIGN